MWSVEKISIGNSITKYKIKQGANILSCQELIDLLKSNRSFINFFNEIFIASPYEAYFWEVEPVTMESKKDEFEFVLIDSKQLVKVKSDSSSFEKYFGENKFVTTFLNLGKDSRLVVPVKTSDSDDYGHLAKFVRSASEEQMVAFWELVAEEFDKSIGSSPKWLSTSGLGVYWLHVRIDSRPKYYNYPLYK